MLKKYLLGGDATPVAGDGLGLAHRPAPTHHRSSSDQRQASLSLKNSRESDAPLSPPLIEAPGIPHAAAEWSQLPSPQLEVPQEEQEPKEDLAWQDFAIPEELRLLDDDVPHEIRNVVQESFDEQEATRASRMQSNAESRVEASQGGNEEDPMSAENPGMLSTRSLASSPSSENRKDSSISLSQESITTLGSDTPEASSLLQPPSADKNLVGAPKRLFTKAKATQPESANTMVTRMESKFRESKERSSKSRGLYGLFKSRRPKAVPSVPVVVNVERPPCECISCFDEVPHSDAVDGLACRHRYCIPCFTQLVNTAIINEDTFPPKCCLTEIPKLLMVRHLPEAEQARFNEKSLEYAVPLADRFYCVSPECARWIDARNAERAGSVLTCQHCQTKLCTICRGPQHPGDQDCPQDYALDATMAEAEQAGWRRCHNCRAMVELNTGCRHITCKCRAEFCYTCGAVWHTCACTEADQRAREAMLIQERQNRENAARAEAEEIQRAIAAVEEAERRLREEREAEEAREQARLEREAEELAQREVERVERIGVRFAELRVILDHVGVQQKLAIEKRHFMQEEANDELQINLDDVISEREQEIYAEKDVKAKENEKFLKQLQKKHAAAIMEAIQRHRRDQDGLLARELTEEESGGDPEMAKAMILETLMPLQEQERTTLKEQHKREVEKWKMRNQRAGRINTTVKIQQMRFEEEEKVARKIDEFNRQQEAELRWIDVMHAERVNMLAEDERRLIVSGNDLDTKGPSLLNDLGSSDLDNGEGPSSSRHPKTTAIMGNAIDFLDQSVPGAFDAGSEVRRSVSGKAKT